MNITSIACLGKDRVRNFGTFEIPAFSEDVQFDSRRMIAAMTPTKYERGYLYYMLDVTKPDRQKIQVHDLIWGLWGTVEAAHEQMVQVQHYIDNDLAAHLLTFNTYNPDKLQVAVTVLYSDNPQYPPDSVPRYVVCRISRAADFV